MYIVDEQYFLDYIEIPNIDEFIGDKAEELERYIDKYARQFLLKVLDYELFKDLDQYVIPNLVDPIVANANNQVVIATEGQTVINLSYVPKSIIVIYNQTFTSEYTIVDRVLTFNEPLSAGDEITLIGTDVESELDIDFVLDDNAPEKWNNLVYGHEYTDSNGVLKKWKGLVYQEGNAKISMIADYVFYQWLKDNVSQLTGVGDVAGNAKGTTTVNPRQRLITVWNDFVDCYQITSCSSAGHIFRLYDLNNSKVTLSDYLIDQKDDFPNVPFMVFDYENQLGV